MADPVSQEPEALDAKLDARPDRIDVRDRWYSPPLRSLPAQWPAEDMISTYFPQYAAQDLILNQGTEGACTGFGLACVINYLLWKDKVTGAGLCSAPFKKVSPRMLYHLARHYDEWPGEDYSGSSCRGAIKAWHKHGVCSEELWPYSDEQGNFVQPTEPWRTDSMERPLGVYYRIEKSSIVDMQAALYEVGAIYVSANVHNGWRLRNARVDLQQPLSHANLELIQSSDKNIGGHAFALVGYNKDGFIVQNSWGPSWGTLGFAVLSYDDWLANATDVWVCVLGAPTSNTRLSPLIVSQKSGMAQTTPSAQPATWLFGIGGAKPKHPYPTQGPSARWDTSLAYQHTVVMGNNGRVIQREIIHANAAAEVRRRCADQPYQWLKNRGTNKHLKLAVFCHGGLNKEQESIERIRVLGPYFKANGIYPLFITWRTGLVESLLGILGDALERQFPGYNQNWQRQRRQWQPGRVDLSELTGRIQSGVTEALDRTIEVICESAGPKTLWSQMKQNALQACDAQASRVDPRGCVQMVECIAHLNTLIAQTGGELEIHTIGHSAGSILLGHMLALFGKHGLKLKTCTLYSPACSIAFANQNYVSAVETGVIDADNFTIWNLVDNLELADSVGPYNKSLLYLVSRALEDQHKTPLLGLETVLTISDNQAMQKRWHPATVDEITKWQKFYKINKKVYAFITEKQVPNAVSWGSDGSFTALSLFDACHGGFDNDINVITHTLQNIKGGDLVVPVTNLDY